MNLCGLDELILKKEQQIDTKSVIAWIANVSLFTQEKLFLIQIIVKVYKNFCILNCSWQEMALVKVKKRKKKHYYVIYSLSSSLQ